MKRIIHFCFGDEARLVGELRYYQQGSQASAAFAYASKWLASTDRFQLDPALPWSLVSNITNARAMARCFMVYSRIRNLTVGAAR